MEFISCLKLIWNEHNKLSNRGLGKLEACADRCALAAITVFIERKVSKSDISAEGLIFCCKLIPDNRRKLWFGKNLQDDQLQNKSPTSNIALYTLNKLLHFDFMIILVLYKLRLSFEFIEVTKNGFLFILSWGIMMNVPVTRSEAYIFESC